MIQPPFLQKGNKVAIVAPARSVTFEQVFPAMKLFQRWGLEVVLGNYIFGKQNQFSGTEEQRRTDLQQMLDDPSIGAIVAARGGYGTARIIDQLNFSHFQKKPKWIVGYSDLTALHAHIHQNFGIQTLHATMPLNISDPDKPTISTESLRKALFGEKISYQQRITSYDKPGLMQGIITGGNLSILYSLMGSESEVSTEGKILLLEDLDEYLYHIDRMMITLKRARKLESLKGLIVGTMHNLKDNEVPFGKTAQEIILQAVSEYSYPVCFDFPVGHGKENVAIYLGRKSEVRIEDMVLVTFH